jgi:hypothetical protein
LNDGLNINEDVIMLRNPWGKTSYNKKWNFADPAWTDALVK